MKKMFVLAFMALLLLQGCGTGYNRVLLVTRSNVGIDIDTEPPSLQIAISRKEGVIEPTFEGGKTLPVEASFSTTSNGFLSFFYGTSSTFATGEAAIAMTALYDEGDANLVSRDTKESDETDHNKGEHIVGGKEKTVELRKYEGIGLNHKPKALRFWRWLTWIWGGERTKEIQLLEPGMVKPVFFGTDTSFGLNVKWNNPSSPVPNSVKLGFNRKEMAWAPVTMETDIEKDGKEKVPYRVNMPSLIATMQHDVKVAGAEEGPVLNWLQYFATGDAATNLALRKEVREAMLMQSNPSFSLANRQHVSKEMRYNIMKDILTAFSKKKDAEQKTFLKDINSKDVFKGEIKDANDLKRELKMLVIDAPSDSDTDTELKTSKLKLIENLCKGGA